MNVKINREKEIPEEVKKSMVQYMNEKPFTQQIQKAMFPELIKITDIDYQVKEIPGNPLEVPLNIKPKMLSGNIPLPIQQRPQRPRVFPQQIQKKFIRKPLQFKPFPRPFMQRNIPGQFPQTIPLSPAFSKSREMPTPAPKPSNLTRASHIEKLNIISLEKINSLLKDPTIQTIECPGPGKQVLVFRAGVIQTTNLALTLDEITNIMKEISEKTRIPLGSGIYKAAVDDFIVTAVMSEFVGTRFIIQKKLQTPPPSPAI